MKKKLDQEHPGWTFDQRKEEITKSWKFLSHDDKSTFRDLAEKDKKRYELEYDEWIQERYLYNEMMLQNKKKKKKPKGDYNFIKAGKQSYSIDPSQLSVPKRATTPFQLFTQEERDLIRTKMAHCSMSDITGAIKLKWDRLSREDRKPYEVKAAQDKRRHLMEMEAFRSLGGKLHFEKKLEKETQLPTQSSEGVGFEGHGGDFGEDSSAKITLAEEGEELISLNELLE